MHLTISESSRAAHRHPRPPTTRRPSVAFDGDCPLAAEGDSPIFAWLRRENWDSPRERLQPSRPRVAMRQAALCAAMALVAGCSTDPGEKPRVLAFSGPVMGTHFQVTIVDPPPGDAAVELRRAVETRLNALDGLLSTYQPSSEVSLLNHSTSVQWVDVSEETAEVVAEAIQASLITDGAFDVTCGPLVNLWGFGPERPAEDDVPTDEQIALAKASVGFEHLDFQLNPPAVRKAKPELYVDLSGVAKGYAVDQIAVLLRGAGMRSFLIDIGGDVRAQGTSPKGRPWRIGIESPVPNARGVQRIVELGDMALATSGDYRNYFAQGEVKYSHVIDPRTGRPIQHRLASVSVLDPSCARADALATGLLVLGPEAGYRLAVEFDIPVFMIIRTDAGFVERSTPGFEAAWLVDDR